VIGEAFVVPARETVQMRIDNGNLVVLRERRGKWENGGGMDKRATRQHHVYTSGKRADGSIAVREGQTKIVLQSSYS
jgi:hypothetical protein